jgi:ABC-type Fe3+ transport system substrate-binding protein
MALVHAAEVEDGKKAGAPVEWVKTLDPIVTSPSVVALSARAPHPNAARLLVDFLLSAEGQRLIAGQGRVPARIDIADGREQGPQSLKLHYVNPDLARDFNRFEKEFRETFQRR